MEESQTAAGLHDCRGPTFFRLIEALFPDDTLRAPAHRWMSIMRQLGATSYFVEHELLDPKEQARLDRELAAIGRRLNRRFLWSVFKLTFFAENPSGRDPGFSIAFQNPEGADRFLEAATRSGSEQTLGYCTILVLEVRKAPMPAISYIFESVSRTFAELGAHPDVHGRRSGLAGPNNFFLHARQEFPGCVASYTYRFTGNYFCQQNSITSVCAHATLAMGINNSPISPRPGLFGLFSCEDVNHVLGLDHTSHDRRLAISDTTIELASGTDHTGALSGLFDRQMDQVLVAAGFEVSRLSPIPDAPHATPLTQFVYSSIESGIPCILILQTEDPDTRHCVTVVGHTLNHHCWIPYRKRIGNISARSSSDWVDHFIVHDDANGMQSTLPTSDFDVPDKTPASCKLGISIVEAVSITPRDWQIRIGGPLAEGLGLQAASLACTSLVNIHPTAFENLYLRRLQRALHSEGLSFAVLRTQLVGCPQYLQHLEAPDANGNTYQPASTDEIRRLVHARGVPRVWLVELSEPNLYVGNSAKVADVLVDPSIDPFDAECHRRSIIFVRFPNLILHAVGERISVYPTPERQGRTSLFRNGT
jgi:hypothetical protein